MSRTWTPEDAAAMDSAAEQAQAELAELLKNNDLQPGIMAILNLHRDHFATAGHKRLGRLYVNLAKQLSQE